MKVNLHRNSFKHDKVSEGLPSNIPREGKPSLLVFAHSEGKPSKIASEGFPSSSRLFNKGYVLQIKPIIKRKDGVLYLLHEGIGVQ